MTALHRARGRLSDVDDGGFTLIELLVVVIIIGVLAAIAIPIYIGVQNSAKDGAVKSDLTAAKQAALAYSATTNGHYPDTLTPATLRTFGYSDVSVAYAADAAPQWAGNTRPVDNSAAFCIWARSPSGATFSITATGGVAAGGC